MSHLKTPSVDPNSAADEQSGLFGLTASESDCAVVCLPVPWEVTTSYGGGTSNAPRAILKASHQVDLFDGDVERPYEAGICLLDESETVREWNAHARTDAQKIIAADSMAEKDPSLTSVLAHVNETCGKLNEFVRIESLRRMEAGKIVGILGGDHAVAFGAFEAAAQAYEEFGLLHFDAHHDFRRAYEGFTWSHASIMRNALDEIAGISKLVSVGVRDYCEEEAAYARSAGERVRTFYDRDLARRKYRGETWSHIAREIVEELPENIWVSFDIDGLAPHLCPHTGTPVPGGQNFNEVNYILGEAVRSGRKILGFDLVEVSLPSSNENEWDANVGARLLYKLAAWSLASQGKAKPQP